MWLPDTARTHTAVQSSHVIAVRVEVWHGGQQIGEVGSDRIIPGGAVTADWATGIRRNLDMAVEPSKDWLRWLTIGVELRPFRGVRFGPVDDTEWCPLGRFPVRQFTRPSSATALPIRAQDRWQWITSNPLGGPRPATPGRAVDNARSLIREVDKAADIQVTALSDVRTPDGVWDRGRHETIADLCTAAGAEAYYNRVADVIVRDLPAKGAAQPLGAVIDMTEQIDWAPVNNAVVVISTNTEVKLPPVRRTITDRIDPAHPSNISGGVAGRGSQTLVYSAAFDNYVQMVRAAESLLRKGAAPARQFSVTCVPHPGLDESDTVLLPLDEPELAQIQQINYPLTADSPQQITTVSTRDAELIP